MQLQIKVFSDMIPKNNPFYLRYSRSCRYLGLDLNRRQEKGYCRFVDVSFACLAIADLFMVTYQKKGLKNYSELLGAIGIDPLDLPRFVFPFDVPRSVPEFSELIYQVALFRSGLSYVNKNRLSPDFIAGVIKSHDLELWQTC